MESDILNVADYAVQQPGVTGYICVDNQGLCLAAYAESIQIMPTKFKLFTVILGAKGQVSQSMSGIIHQLADLASKIEAPSQVTNGTLETKDSPVIRVDLERYRIMIQSRDKITTALISSQK